jgi:DNA-binding transcriptional regulator YbjK
VARRDEVLDGAVIVLGEGGMRAFTHRAVDAVAGVPVGTTANYFPTRDALLIGVVEHFAEREKAAWSAIAGRPAPGTPERLAAALGAFLGEAVGPHRTLALARHALMLEAAHRPPLRQSLAASAESIRRRGAAWMAGLGSSDPEADAQVVLDHLDGILMHRLAFDERTTDPERALTILIRALIASPHKAEA